MVDKQAEIIIEALEDDVIPQSDSKLNFKNKPPVHSEAIPNAERKH